MYDRVVTISNNTHRPAYRKPSATLVVSTPLQNLIHKASCYSMTYRTRRNPAKPQAIANSSQLENTQIHKNKKSKPEVPYGK